MSEKRIQFIGRLHPRCYDEVLATYKEAQNEVLEGEFTTTEGGEAHEGCVLVLFGDRGGMYVTLLLRDESFAPVDLDQYFENAARYAEGQPVILAGFERWNGEAEVAS